MAARAEEGDIAYGPELRAHGFRDARVWVQNQINGRIARNLDERRGNGFQPFAPALPAVAGYKYSRPSALTGRKRRQLGLDRQDGVDARVAGDVDLSGDLLCTQVIGGDRGRSERRSARASMAIRYSSSGQGSRRSCVRRPASTCAT